MCACRELILSRISLPYRLLCPRKLFLTVRLRLHVNFMVGWYEFACSMKCSISSSFVSHKQNTSSMNLFHVSGLLTLCLKISFSIDAIKMLAKATAILVPMAVPCVWR